MSDRFVEPPEGWFSNPECDLHGATDLVTHPDGPHCIGVWERDDGLFSVALDTGLHGNTGPEDYDQLTVHRAHVQTAVDLLAARVPTE